MWTRPIGFKMNFLLRGQRLHKCLWKYCLGQALFFYDAALTAVFLWRSLEPFLAGLTVRVALCMSGNRCHVKPQASVVLYSQYSHRYTFLPLRVFICFLSSFCFLNIFLHLLPLNGRPFVWLGEYGNLEMICNLKVTVSTLVQLLPWGQPRVYWVLKAHENLYHTCHTLWGQSSVWTEIVSNHLSSHSSGHNANNDVVCFLGE